MLLGSLVAHDRTQRVELLATLETYLDSGWTAKRAAEALHIHRNALMYRIRLIDKVAQVDLEDSGTLLLIQLALRAARVLTMVPVVDGRGEVANSPLPTRVGPDVLPHKPAHTTVAVAIRACCRIGVPPPRVLHRHDLYVETGKDHFGRPSLKEIHARSRGFAEVYYHRR